MRVYFTTIILLILPLLGLTQSISDLQKQKQETQAEIEYTTRLLEETQQSEKTSLNKLRLLNNQINQRTRLISTLSDEIAIYDQCIQNSELSIEMLQNDLQQLREEYAEMIRLAYKNRDVNNELLFLLSAESFNQAYRRLLYFRRYSQYRKDQGEIIGEVSSVLNDNIKKLEERKEEKQTLVDQTRQEYRMLAGEKGQQDTELQKLADQKRNLQQTLRQQRKIELQLEQEIQRIIEEEARKNRANGEPGYALTPEQKLIGDNFEQNKHRLPWPVERGVIVERFGVHQHPVLTNVQVRNNGVNIATEIGSKVRAVFKGEVSRVFGISGGNMAVIIRHGAFLTVYSNLREVVVKKGDLVDTKQDIGTVYTDYDDDGKSILKFQIWQESQKMDPEDWIVR
ncbi:murein hydrolase activator EnvC family protein [Maribellus sediminis]|uniref:murein hydrolase activator EnvC family protein n=1 Tax=Maribellus sediminis TaxID=2696285 RepID=UPI0014318EBE|nr:peptidoglycan DD-metalloendopeptidase family protein [Maribellus sediminis]